MCPCGRSHEEAASFVYSSSHGRFVFHRCLCGDEWTERVGAGLPHDPVSTDELIEVHLRLSHFEGSLLELLGNEHSAARSERAEAPGRIGPGLPE